MKPSAIKTGVSAGELKGLAEGGDLPLNQVKESLWRYGDSLNMAPNTVTYKTTLVDGLNIA